MLLQIACQHCILCIKVVLCSHYGAANQANATHLVVGRHIALQSVSTCGHVLPSSTNVRPQMSWSLYYKFVAVPQEGLLSSSLTGRWLSIRFFSKALVGEHRTSSFFSLYVMAMIVTPPCSPDVPFAHSLDPLFHQTNIFEHALLHESHYLCPRGIYYFLCSVRPISVRKYTCRPL